MKKTVIAVLLCLVSSSAFAGLRPGDTAPPFSLRDSGGKEVSLRDLLGAKKNGKVKGVVLSFFASWCLPCRHELPLIDSFVDEMKAKGIAVAVVDVREDFDAINGLLSGLHVKKPLVLSDRYGKASESYQVIFLPVTYFIGADGRVKDVIYGGIVDGKQFHGSVNKLLR
jgi:thiol-disulfide isomerase/thioredoxin